MVARVLDLSQEWEEAKPRIAARLPLVDHRQFDKLVAAAMPSAKGLAMRLEPSTWEDLLQESIVRAYQSFSSYRQDGVFTNWLLRIITRKHLDHRRRYKGPVYSLTDTSECGMAYADTIEARGLPMDDAIC